MVRRLVIKVKHVLKTWQGWGSVLIAEWIITAKSLLFSWGTFVYRHLETNFKTSPPPAVAGCIWGPLPGSELPVVAQSEESKLPSPATRCRLSQALEMW